jgi:hypothetical protein
MGSTSWHTNKCWTLLRKPCYQLLWCIIFFLFYGQFQTYFMEIWTLFSEIHNFKRPT